MSQIIRPAETYNPVEYVEKNAEFILPERSKLLNINFSGFEKKAFHSNKRPKGDLTLWYQNEEGFNQIRLFVKQHDHALPAYNHMLKVYKHFTSLGFNPHIPKPIICDEKNNANYIEYIAGSPFNFKVLKELFIRKDRQLVETFYNIGSWLKNYHNAAKLENTFILSDLKKSIVEELDTTDLFEQKEKSKIKSHLDRLEFEDTYLLLVKTHNDFALRNILHADSNDFYIIDWDAVFHDKFTNESPVWVDITSFIVSLNSLQRFSPVITAGKIKSLTDAFLNGYFKDVNKPSQNKEIKNQLYLFSLGFYLGIIGENPLPIVYKNKLGYRYMARLHSNLMHGFIL